jgi:hypothetical protein
VVGKENWIYLARQAKSGARIMAESLGILVSSDKHLDYVAKFTSAAHKKGKAVRIFFTG